MIDQGVKHIGENRVDKFLEKYHASLSDEDVTWHLVAYKEEKSSDIIPLLIILHALDSLKLPRNSKRTVLLNLQVNISERKASMVFLKRRTIDSLIRILV